MLLEDRERQDEMTSELNLNFRCDEEYRDWLCIFVGKLDTDRSKYMREAITMYSAFVEIFPDIRKLSVDRLRKDPEFVRNIFVLLEKV